MERIRPGMAIRNASAPNRIGTIAGFAQVRGDATGAIYMISCSHVLAPYHDLPPGGGRDIETLAGVRVASLFARTLNQHGQGDAWHSDAALAKVDRNAAAVDLSMKGVGPLTGRSAFRHEGLLVYIVGQDDERPKKGCVKDAWQGSIAFTFDTIDAGPKTYLLREATSVEAIDAGFGNPGDSGAMVFNRFGLALGVATFLATGSGDRYFAPIGLVLRDLERAAGFTPGTLQLVTGADHVELPTA